MNWQDMPENNFYIYIKLHICHNEINRKKYKIQKDENYDTVRFKIEV